jgi:hypothetical protein
VGFCFTNPDSQIVMPTVAKDVAVGLRRRGLTKAETATRVDAVLRTYGLDAHADHAAHRLSGGQKQLLALASVLATEQELLVMDDRVLELINDHVTRYPPRAVTLALGQERRSGADFNSTIWHPALVAVGIEPKRETGCHAPPLLREYAAGRGRVDPRAERVLRARDPGFTLRTYTHLTPSSTERTKAAIDEMLSVPSAPHEPS